MAEQRIVNCIKLNQELPGLAKPPVPGELGQKVFENVSKQAFQMFLDHFKMVVNEYKLDLTSSASDKIFLEQMNEYFFGGGADLPGEYVPPSTDNQESNDESKSQ
jgi:Fe-S cluster biosynthesis and repair protein YggX